MFQRRLGAIFYSKEKDGKYKVIRGLENSCKGCCFCVWFENGDSECQKPDDAGLCLAEDRKDGIDIIFKEV